MSKPACWLLALASAALVACQSAGQRDDPIADAGPRQSAGAEHGAAPHLDETPEFSSASMRAALDQALADRDSGERASFHLLVECKARILEAFGSNIAIVNLQEQYELAGGQVDRFLEILLSHGFPEMQAAYTLADSGNAAVSPDNGEKPPKIVACRIGVDVAGLTKQLVRLDRDEPDLQFHALAEELLAESANRSGAAVVAADLGDGLDKLAQGLLSPQTFSLQYHVKPIGAGGDVRTGLLLRIAGDEATTRTWEPGVGYGEIYGLEFPPSDMLHLAELLRQHEFVNWPGNLFSPVYTDLRIEVLQHPATVQAQRFTGMNAATHGRHQAAFDTLSAYLKALHRQILAEGAAQRRQAGEAF